MQIIKEANNLIKEISSKKCLSELDLFNIKMLCEYLLEIEDCKEDYLLYKSHFLRVESLIKLNRFYYKLNLFVCSRKYHKYCNSCQNHEHCSYNLLHKNLYVSNNI